MTYNDDFTLPKAYLEQLAEGGMDYMPELIRVLLNAAMRAERQKHLGVFLWQLCTKILISTKTISTTATRIFWFVENIIMHFLHILILVCV